MGDHLDEDAIFGLAEGGLDASARAAAEAHLQGCAACRREVETAAGYFREIAGLEPVQAPANFLANVRARLPRPSPLRAFLDVFMKPLRVIPMQVALLTILGLTAISSYLYQRGGLHKEDSSGISESAAEPAAETVVQKPVASVPLAREREERDAKKSVSRVTSAPGKSEGYARSPSPVAAKPSLKKSSQAQAESESLSDESLRESEPPIASDRAAPAPAPASPPASHKAEAPVARPVPVPASREAAPPAPAEATGAMEPAPVAEEAAKEKKAETRSGSRDKALADTQDREGYPASGVLGNSGAIGSAELPAYIVKLAPGKRIGNVVSGLKAMGADSLSARSAWTAGDSGGKGIDYMFQVPASMRKEIAPYLERYGKVEGAGLLPASGTAPSRIRIRFVP